jgi:hypothetical protein
MNTYEGMEVKLHHFWPLHWIELQDLTVLASRKSSPSYSRMRVTDRVWWLQKATPSLVTAVSENVHLELYVLMSV